MKLNEAYTCPHCGSNEVNLKTIQQIFNDARYEEVECTRCFSSWRIYYKLSELSIEQLVTPDKSLVDSSVIVPTDIKLEES